MSQPPAHRTAVAYERAHLVLPLLALWLLFSTPWRALALPDEGRYVGVAWGLRHGDALLPTLHGLPYFHKPPLMYWIDAAAMVVLGPVEIAARLAPVFGAWLLGAALWWHLRREAGARTAGWALLVLATMPLFFGAGQFANHDMLVAGWITVAMLCALRAVEPQAVAWRRWTVAAWAAAALAVLSKGLIGVVLPALVLVPWLLWRRRWRGLARLLHPSGVLAFALLALPWFVAMQQRVPGFAEYFFVEQHFRRYAAGGFNNVQPAWFFVVALPLLTLPWSLWLPAAVRALGGDARHEAPPGGRPGGRLDGLYAWWIVVVVLFFSLPESKLVGYVLPALAPWAALLARAATRAEAPRAGGPGRPFVTAAVGSALVCVAAMAAIAARDGASHRDVGRALAGLRDAGDRVVLVDEPFFDLPFYARLTTPPLVLADWQDPAIPRRDDWRKELQDAARFASPADAARLVDHGRAASLLCGRGTVWFVAPPAWAPPAALAGLERVQAGRGATLWRGRAADCADEGGR